MNDLYRILETVTHSTKGLKVLATIVNVEGSAYKKEGSSMLIMEDKTRVGMLTAGCLEEDLVERASQVWNLGEPLVVQYDMSVEHDLSWGLGAGCNGVLTILLEPVKGRLEKDLLTVKKNLDSKKSITRIKRFTENLEPREDVYVVEDGTIFGEGDFINIENLCEVIEMTYPYELKNGMRKSERYSDFYFIQQMGPKPCLYIFGAGEDARPLASFAVRTGFHVTVIDWRPALCHRGNFPDANQLIVGKIEEVMKELQFTKRDFVVIMTHSFEKDRTVLRNIKNKELFYKGVLGPKRRTERLWGDEEIPEEIHTPVGLTIGAKEPEEIAISIVAEMINKMRNNGKLNL